MSNEFLSSVVASLQQGLGTGGGGVGGGVMGSGAGSVSSGNTPNKGGGSGVGGGGYPANATQNEIKIWDNTQKAFANEEVSWCLRLMFIFLLKYVEPETFILVYY